MFEINDIVTNQDGIDFKVIEIDDTSSNIIKVKDLNTENEVWVDTLHNDFTKKEQVKKLEFKKALEVLKSESDVKAKKETTTIDGNVKTEYHLLPWKALEQIAAVFTFGKEKYGEYNYSNQSDNTTYISAAMRHIQKYMSGIDLDNETGKHHIAHAISNLMMLLDNEENKTGNDNRNKKYK